MTNNILKRKAITNGILLTTVLLVLRGGGSVSAEEIEKFLRNNQRLLYNGYKVTTSKSKRGDRSITSVRRGPRLLVKWVNRDAPINDSSSRTGLLRLLRTHTKQLVIQQFSGGAHCCLSWRIYDLFPKFRLVFDSEPYPIADAMNDAELVDIDRDGTLELIFYSNRFSYFDEYCFACLARPPVVFRYDAESGRYLPANHIFRRFALAAVKAEITRMDELKRTQLENSFPYVLDVVLRYVYAGMRSDAWRFFDRHYSGRDARAMKLKIKHRLRGDGVYRFLYTSGRPRNVPDH